MKSPRLSPPPMNNIIPFEHDKIRKIWHNEEWYFSVIDIIEVLTESPRPRKYWNALKTKLMDEGSELSQKMGQLKLRSLDGKFYKTDVANIETLLRLIQSIPSPKAEPLKLWLAKVGTERITEIQDPSQALNRARNLWKKYGRSEKWIQQRMMGQETRNRLTDYWNEHDVKKGDEYAILTNIIHEEWTDLSVKEHKELKKLGRFNNLRDHMNEAELILTALAELSTRQIAESITACGLEENKVPAKKGGQIAKHARKELESKTGRNVISSENFLPGRKRLR